jgi:sugar diacid utilization regulator
MSGQNNTKLPSDSLQVAEQHTRSVTEQTRLLHTGPLVDILNKVYADANGGTGEESSNGKMLNLESSDLLFLRLLSSESPLDAFDEALCRAQADVSPVASAERHEVLAQALRVRQILDRQQRQAQELTALHETALDLAATHDLDSLLRAICRRARALLRTDVAYLALEDHEHGDTFISTTDGVQSDEFKGLRLPPGVGIGGLVAKTGQPIWTADYLTDSRFTHAPSLDSAVGSEALRSLAGVPLERDGEIHGVLMAGNRGPRPFDQQDVDLLRSLAAHASVAIERARLFADTKTALAKLSEANRLVEAHSQTIERSAALHERLTSLLIEGAGMQEILRASVAVLDGRITVLDKSGAVIGAAGTPQDPLDERLEQSHRIGSDRAEQLLMKSVFERSDVRSVSIDLGEKYCTRISAPMHAKSEALGAIVLTRRDIAEDDRRNIERVALVVALHLTNERTVAEAEIRVRGDLLYDFLSRPPGHQEDTERQAYRLSMDLSKPYAVVCAAMDSRSRRGSMFDAAALATEHEGLAGEGNGSIIVLLPWSDSSAAVQAVSQRLNSRQTTATVGGAGPAVGVHALQEAYKEAQQCQRLLLALNKQGSSATTSTLGILGMLFSASSKGQIEDLIERTLGPLIRYDKQHRTQLFSTLRSYLAAGGHMAQTAKAEHIHINTLYGRLLRLTAILGEDWKESDERMQLQLAVRLRELREELDTPNYPETQM